MKQFTLILIRPAGIEIKSGNSIRWIHTNLFRLSCMKLRMGLKNFKGVLPVCSLIYIATSDRLSFASVDIDKNYLLTPPW